MTHPGWKSHAPGDDRNFFLPKKPAVYRRTLDVPKEWLANHSRVWIYLWDLNAAWGQPVSIHLNGKLVAKEPCQHPYPHWMQVEVTKALARVPTRSHSACLPDISRIAFIFRPQNQSNIRNSELG